MKFLNLLGMMGLASFAVSANAQSVLSVENFTVSAGDAVEVSLLLENEEEVNAFNFDIVLPSCLTLEDYDLTPRTKVSSLNKWSFDADDSNPGIIRVMASTTKTAAYLAAGGSGAVWTMTFSATEDYSGDLCLNNVVVAGPDNKNQTTKFKIANLGKNGYSSYSNVGTISPDMAISGATPYYGTVESEKLVLTEVADNIVLAGEGVVLKGDEGAAVYATTAVATNKTPANQLKGSGSGATVSDVHVLSTEGGVTGFYKYTGSTIDAGKAYLSVGSSARILFADDATGLEGLEAAQGAKTVFNLQGQMVKGAANGISVVNGKKVMY